MSSWLRDKIKYTDPILLQRQLAVAMVPAYVLLFPFGFFFHLAIAFWVVRVSGHLVPAVSSQKEISQLHRAVFSFGLTWLFLPLIMTMILPHVGEANLNGMLRPIIAVSKYSLFPTSLAEYAYYVEKAAGLVGATRYAFTTYFIPFFPAIGLIVWPTAPHGVTLRLATMKQVMEDDGRSFPEMKLSHVTGAMIIVTVGCITRYCASFRLSHDAGVIGQFNIVAFAFVWDVFLFWVGFTAYAFCFSAGFCRIYYIELVRPKAYIAYVRDAVRRGRGNGL